MAKFKIGDTVRASYEGRTVKAEIIAASPGTLIISWDDGSKLGSHEWMMPITQNADGSYASMIEGLPVTLVKVREE